MKRILHLVLMLLVSMAILTATSCKKDDDEKSKTEMLASGSWKMSAWQIDPPIDFQGLTYSDLYALLPDCSKDDFTTFNDDGTFVDDEGATKCDAGDPQTVPGTWSLNEDAMVITMTQQGETYMYDLKEITESKFVLEFEETEDFGNGEQMYTNTITFVKK
ncbi:MAG: lipocalin family protein [Bacteroidales bacterium]